MVGRFRCSNITLTELTIRTQEGDNAMSTQAHSPTKTRPGLKMGQANEYFLMTPITPEGAKRLRKILADGWTGDRQKITDRIGTVHDLRILLIDNDTRVIFA